MLLNILVFFFLNIGEYLRIFADIKKICGYPNNRDLHGYGDGYVANIYLMGMVRGSYPYPTHPVDIPSYTITMYTYLRITFRFKSPSMLPQLEHTHKTLRRKSPQLVSVWWFNLLKKG